MDRTLQLPSGALVVLMGPAGCGKTTFAHAHFATTEVLSADWLRALVSDDPADPRASADAFEVMYLVTDRRLKRGRLVVSDATNVTAEKRQPLLSIARRHRMPAIAIVFDLPVALCVERNSKREDRQVPVAAIHTHRKLLLRSLPHLRGEGFEAVHVLRTAAEVGGVTISRRR